MDDEARVGLVDAHAERVGGDHDAALAIHEQVLVVLALARRQLAVIARDALAQFPQPRRQVLDGLDGGRIHDAHARRLAQQAQDFVLFLSGIRDLDHAVAQIGTVDAGIDDLQLARFELRVDIVDHFPRGRGRQRQHGRTAQRAQGGRDFQVGGTEVVAPLGNAMGFIDDDQAGRRAGQQGQELGHRQAFRRAKDNEPAALGDAGDGVVLFGARQAAVELHGRNAQFLQLFQLVFHQRNQRRHDQGRARQQRGGQLVAQGLAAAGGHDGQGVAPGQHAVDDFLLARAQPRHAEDRAQQALDVSTRLVQRSKHHCRPKSKSTMPAPLRQGELLYGRVWRTAIGRAPQLA
ncbi:hypothetical protein D3C72_925990 [compost metagenome]